MKSSIKHGAILRCDMVFVDAEDNFKNECRESFVTYSVSSIVREQAVNADWARPKAGRVKWPGNPPCANAKKVDLCPAHAALIMSDAEVKQARTEAKAKRKAERELAKAERKAAKKAAKLAAKKPRAPRKRKTAPQAEATA
jgi:sRNA-binding protein